MVPPAGAADDAASGGHGRQAGQGGGYGRRWLLLLSAIDRYALMEQKPVASIENGKSDLCVAAAWSAAVGAGADPESRILDQRASCKHGLGSMAPGRWPGRAGRPDNAGH